MRSSTNWVVWLGIGIVVGIAGCSGEDAPPLAAIDAPSQERSARVALPPTLPDEARQVLRVKILLASHAIEGIADAGSGPGMKVHLICDEKKLPSGLLHMQGWHFSDYDQRWKIDGEMIDPGAVDQYLDPRIADLQRAGIAVHGSKATCKEFDAALESLAAYCVSHNIDLFRTIPTGSPFCHEFMCGAVWMVQARPLNPASAELMSMLLGDWTDVICDAGKLRDDLLNIFAAPTDVEWQWRIGKSTLAPEELERYLESRKAELRVSGILVRELESIRDKKTSQEFELISRFC